MKVPKFLYNHPRDFVNHCVKMMDSANIIPAEEIELISDKGIFLIKSQPSLKILYKVDFAQPSCTCTDWGRSHRICKHFLAVFKIYGQEWGWEALPPSYKENPFISLDVQYARPGASHMVIVSRSKCITETSVPPTNPANNTQRK